jgi:adenylate cyclase
MIKRILSALLCLALSWPLWSPADRRWFDLASNLLRSHGHQSAPVVLVGLDEATEKAFPEPLALWHRHLGGVFEALAVAQPLAVGVDINLPMRSFDDVMPGGDAALLRGILRLRQTCPLILGITVDEGGRPRPVHAPFQTAAGAEGTGFVLWERDPDSVVRRFTEHFNGSPEAVPTLSGRLARALGHPVRDGWLDYRGAPPVPYVPLHLVEAWGREGKTEALRRTFQGKAVLIGSVLPFVDRHYQAVDINGWGEENQRLAPGALLHVQALRNHLEGGPLRAVPAWLPFALALGCTALGACFATRPRLGVLALLGGWLLVGVLALGLQWRGVFFGPSAGAAGLLAGFGVLAGWEAVEKLRERRRLRSVFGGYVSPVILKEILAGRIHAGLKGQRVELCVLFSDVRGFTTLSEGREPEDIIALLNRYFDRMAPAIHAHGGTVVSYMGDGIMAHFGHPEPMANPCLSAFGAAKAMLAALAELNAEWLNEGLPELKIGIGLHAGAAVVGHLGSRERHEYTAIGDTVNVASRVEGLTKEAGFPLLVTEAVAARLPVEAGLVLLGAKPIKGHSPMAVFGWEPPGEPC